MDILQWVKKNSVEGADLSEAEALIKDKDPLKNVLTKEDALSFIERNELFRKALDSETSRRVETGIENFKEKKLPAILKDEKEKIAKELNPDLTDEQKRIRELEDKIKLAETKEQQQERKSFLRLKAKELAEEHKIKYDPLRAEKYHVYGDAAEKYLSEDISYLKSVVNEELESKLKGQYVGNPPKGDQLDPATVDQKIYEAKKSGDLDGALSSYMQKIKQ